MRQWEVTEATGLRDCSGLPHSTSETEQKKNYLKTPKHKQTKTRPHKHDTEPGAYKPSDKPDRTKHKTRNQKTELKQKHYILEQIDGQQASGQNQAGQNIAGTRNKLGLHPTKNQ